MGSKDTGSKKKFSLIVIILSGVMSPIMSAVALIGILAVAVTPSANFDSWTHKGWDMVWWGLSALILPVIMLACIIAIRRLLPKLWVAVVCNILVFLIALVVVAVGLFGGIAYIQGHPWLA